MSTIRQWNVLGQQRIDVPHIRSLESSIAFDFDLLAGQFIAGKTPVVLSGFYLIETGAIGSSADSLQMYVSDSALIHFEASASGSIFITDSDLGNEILSVTNSNVSGSFTPGKTNYIGLDLVRAADDSTSDTVQFLDSVTDSETPKIVPLARTLKYKIIISETAFSATPGVLPVAVVTTNTSNQVIAISDARNMLFRLGTGGSSPSASAIFGWPGGRDENTGTFHFSGDKAISSHRDWFRAIMTRLWELGGGEFWYSLTADRNVLMTTSTVFATTGSAFEWDGTHLHWQGLQFIFDNSTDWSNTVNNQTTDSVGLTDLVDGECLYVDLDRSTSATLTAQKAVLTSLGSSTKPGNRFVIAWRKGSNVFVRNQPYPVGSAFIVATTLANGMVRLSATPSLPATPLVATVTTGLIAGISGISRFNTGTTGDITIGQGTGSGDQNVIITANDSFNTRVNGSQNLSSTNLAALQVTQNGAAPDTSDGMILDLLGETGSGVNTRFSFDSNGEISLANVAAAPVAPSPTATRPARAKLFMTTNGLATPNTRDRLCVIWHDGTVVILTEGPAY